MAYNEALEQRISAAIEIFPQEIKAHLIKKKMFGGLAFLYHGKMTVGVVNDDLMVRVISSKMPSVLAMDHVRPMDFTNRPMKEFIFVSPEGFKSEAQLQSWIEMGIEHAKTKIN